MIGKKFLPNPKTGVYVTAKKCSTEIGALKVTKKKSLLGKGGTAIVWLAVDVNSGEQVALKQFPKPKNQAHGICILDPTAKIEIEMGRMFYSSQK